MYFNLTLLGFSVIRSCPANIPGNRLSVLVRSGFEEMLYPFKCKIPAKFYPFKDKSLANTFLYHANSGGQNS